MGGAGSGVLLRFVGNRADDGFIGGAKNPPVGVLGSGSNSTSELPAPPALGLPAHPPPALTRPTKVRPKRPTRWTLGAGGPRRGQKSEVRAAARG